ncbi:unnamed protein product [Callosobruchus maculatus]|uniref:Uncharacterized protein n=1 Tax=Callosobruchus maculatus TaxID=64391 RepID=A0A653CAQ3_CALMS|nr:unnamed protein product [Callosobruchus maculatus]
MIKTKNENGSHRIQHLGLGAPSQGKHYSAIVTLRTSNKSKYSKSVFASFHSYVFLQCTLLFSTRGHSRDNRHAASQRWRGGCGRQHVGVVWQHRPRITGHLALLIADHLVKPSSMANHLVRCRRRLAEGHAPSEASENRGWKEKQGDEVAPPM